MKQIQLGAFVADKLTTFNGTVIGKVQYITGCNQVLVQPGDHKEESRWLDEQRVTVDFRKEPVSLDNGENPGFDKAAPRI